MLAAVRETCPSGDGGLSAVFAAMRMQRQKAKKRSDVAYWHNASLSSLQEFGRFLSEADINSA